MTQAKTTKLTGEKLKLWSYWHLQNRVELNKNRSLSALKKKIWVPQFQSHFYKEFYGPLCCDQREQGKFLPISKRLPGRPLCSEFFFFSYSQHDFFSFCKVKSINPSKFVSFVWPRDTSETKSGWKKWEKGWGKKKTLWQRRLYDNSCGFYRILKISYPGNVKGTKKNLKCSVSKIKHLQDLHRVAENLQLLCTFFCLKICNSCGSGP